MSAPWGEDSVTVAAATAVAMMHKRLAGGSSLASGYSNARSVAPALGTPTSSTPSRLATQGRTALAVCTEGRLYRSPFWVL